MGVRLRHGAIGSGELVLSCIAAACSFLGVPPRPFLRLALQALALMVIAVVVPSVMALVAGTCTAFGGSAMPRLRVSQYLDHA